MNKELLVEYHKDTESERVSELAKKMENLPLPEVAWTVVNRSLCVVCHAYHIPLDCRDNHNETCQNIYIQRERKQQDITSIHHAVESLRAKTKETWNRACGYHQQLTTMYISEKSGKNDEYKCYPSMAVQIFEVWSACTLNGIT